MGANDLPSRFKMSFLPFPIDNSDLADLSLTKELSDLAGNVGMEPSTFLKGLTEAKVEEICWFFDTLDNQATALGIAKRQGACFLSLVSANQIGQGKFYIPLREIKGDSFDSTREPNVEVRKLRPFLKDAFASCNVTHSPFFSPIGTDASQWVDFSSAPAIDYRYPWFNSSVFYNSSCGDALLVTPDGQVAWHRLETNEIIPMGDLRTWMRRYIESTFAYTTELSSNNDPVAIIR